MVTDNPNAPLILIVEDDDNHAELMNVSLQGAPEGYRLEIVSTLRDARAAIHCRPPDLVITDYRLPDGEGSELVASLNGLCPVVLMTSQGNERIAVEAMKAGVLDYVVKSAEVFSGMPRIVQRSLREWTLILENKWAEEERRRMELHLLHVQKLESLGTMSAGIAHDFNNLLQAVLGNLELVLMKLPPEATTHNLICHTSARSLLHQALNAAERAAKLSGMILTYAGKGLFTIQSVNLTGLIEKMSAMLTAAVSSSITFDLKLDFTLPPIMADADQIQQVVMNLIINASEAIGNTNGLITLSTGVQLFDQKVLNSSRLEEKLMPGRYVWMKISDSGCGMSADTLDKLFDPFFTTKFTGRGLGMSAVIGVIRAHKGAILVESRLCVGTSIQVLFPITEGVQKVETESAPVDDATAERTTRTILVVDDEEIIREVCLTMLEELGFEALAASGGVEALRIFREQGDRIDLALLDHSMPGMDGVAVFSELRKIRADLPVLLASGYNREDVADRFLGLGLNGFLQKPFNLKRLADELNRVLAEI